jgi:hypothetical protein
VRSNAGDVTQEAHSVHCGHAQVRDHQVEVPHLRDAGVFRYLCKPWQDEELATHIDAALAHSATLREQSVHAQAWHDRLNALSPQEIERRRLEEMEPGITRVKWGPNGEVLMPLLTTIATE